VNALDGESPDAASRQDHQSRVLGVVRELLPALEHLVAVRDDPLGRDCRDDGRRIRPYQASPVGTHHRELRDEVALAVDPSQQLRLWIAVHSDVQLHGRRLGRLPRHGSRHDAEVDPGGLAATR
jgi:hypothetical protein